MKDDAKLVRQTLPYDEILAQLAEEATELAHASLKLRRAIVGNNPTPVTALEAVDRVLEEIGDVAACLVAMDIVDEPEGIKARAKDKLRRWATRLKVTDEQ